MTRRLRDVLKELRDIFADGAQRTAALRALTSAAGWLVNMRLAWQLLGQLSRGNQGDMPT